MKYDDTITAPFINTIRTNETTPYLVDTANWGTGPWKQKLNPMFSNTISIVTGHKYRLHWGKTGLNFEDLLVELDENYLADDKDITFVHNFSDVRAAIEVKFDGQLIANDTIPTNAADRYIGQNLVRNITDLSSKEE